MDEETRVRYTGSGFTSRWTRTCICGLFLVWGLIIAAASFRRTPTREQAEYKQSLAAAKRDGRDPATIPQPPADEMWRDGVPQWTVLEMGIATIAIAAWAEPLWRQRACRHTEKGSG